MGKKDKNVVSFFTECKKTTGSGHLSRCFSLSDAFEEKGFKSRFIIDSDSSCDAEKNITELHRLNWKSDVDSVKEIITKDSLVVIDSYLASQKQLELLSRLTRYPVFISDARLNYYPQ
ncbi:MAG: hypothetical protein ACP5E3_04600, partial [Bacteroidales bacterium]